METGFNQQKKILVTPQHHYGKELDRNNRIFI